MMMMVMKNRMDEPTAAKNMHLCICVFSYIHVSICACAVVVICIFGAYVFMVYNSSIC